MKTSCLICETVFYFDESFAGKPHRCQTCKNIFMLPTPGSIWSVGANNSVNSVATQPHSPPVTHSQITPPAPVTAKKRWGKWAKRGFWAIGIWAGGEVLKRVGERVADPYFHLIAEGIGAFLVTVGAIGAVLAALVVTIWGCCNVFGYRSN